MQPDREAALLDEIAILRERIRQLEAALAPTFTPPVEWQLTGTEARLFAVLLGRDFATKEQIHHSLYGARPDDAVPELKIVDVLICKMRAKLKPFGIAITTIWGQGYALADRQSVLTGLEEAA